MEFLGILKIRVQKGINLAVRDSVSSSSDPYCVLTCGSQKLKTEVVKGKCDPVWNEELTLYIKDLNTPITMTVYDKDTFTVDDNMGHAQIDFKHLMECMKIVTGFEDLPDGSKIDSVVPTRENCLSEESCISWQNGKVVQDMILRLNDVERGEVEVQIEFIDIPDQKLL